MIEKPVIKVNLYDEEYNCYLNIGRYQYNNMLYLALETEEDLFCDITINLPEYMVDGDSSIYVNEDLPLSVKNKLKEIGILSNFLYSVNYNMGRYDCYSTNLNKLKYYDPLGFEHSDVKLDKGFDYNINI